MLYRGPVGREVELEEMAAFLEETPSGLASLLVEGEPGIGKTTLWAEAVRQARVLGRNVLSCRPASSDAGLPYVGLADLLGSVPDDAFGELPGPQRQALAVALLRGEAGPGDLDPRAVAMGLTSLLDALADRGRLLLAIDDAQWLDPASRRALAFAVRRLDERPLWVLATVRVDGAPGKHPPDAVRLGVASDRRALRRLLVGPLSVAATHQLLLGVLGVSFARPVLVRIHGAARGNPFYTLEIAREVQRIGAPSPGRPLPIPDGERDLALLRLRRLPRATRDVLVRVAAASRLSLEELDVEALAAAELAGIVRIEPGGRVNFTHPLYGSALYSSLPEAVRRALHRELAETVSGIEERGRHLALAATGPDEATAEILDRGAAAAAARGAAEVAVELKELALRLTPPEDRSAVVRREIELADRRYFAGDAGGARRELERSLRSLSPGEQRAQVLLELGSVVWSQGEGDEGFALLAQALDEAETPSLRARIHSRTSALAEDCDIGLEHGEAALMLLDEDEQPLLYSFALHNVARWRLYAGRGADHDAVERGMRLQHEGAMWEASSVPAYWARDFDDFETARRQFEELIRAFHERGDEARRCGALAHLAVVEAMTGRIEQARTYAIEALDLAEQTEQETWVLVALWARGQVCMRAGELQEARSAADEVLRRLEANPDRTLERMARAVLGTVAVAVGDFVEADRQLSLCDEIGDSLHVREAAADRYHAEHVEAVIALGELERAEVLVARMEARAEALPRPWILTVSARSRGLLDAARGELDAALADLGRALEASRTLDMPVEVGRTLLALGMLHRRRKERRSAQARLEEALQVFESVGAPIWAAVARDDLRRARGPRRDRDRLTATEQAIADLAASGLRNQDIAARLFLSHKTVEANLSRTYRKLGIRSRAQLSLALAAADEADAART
jgi:DNA-binding CsgD family transcriptional regulator